MIEKIDINGDIFYLKDGLLHKDNGPAIEFKTGTKWWFHKGKLHRDNGPAIVENKKFLIFDYWLNGESATIEEIKNIKRNKIIEDYI